jgi:hypothetical protein
LVVILVSFKTGVVNLDTVSITCLKIRLTILVLLLTVEINIACSDKQLVVVASTKGNIGQVLGLKTKFMVNGLGSAR